MLLYVCWRFCISFALLFYVCIRYMYVCYVCVLVVIYRPTVSTLKWFIALQFATTTPLCAKQAISKRSVDDSSFDVDEGQPHTSALLHSDLSIPKPRLPHLYHKRSVDELENDFVSQLDELSSSFPEDVVGTFRRRRKRDTPLPPQHVIGKSPNVIHYTVSILLYEIDILYLSITVLQDLDHQLWEIDRIALNSLVRIYILVSKLMTSRTHLPSHSSPYTFSSFYFFIAG